MICMKEYMTESDIDSIMAMGELARGNILLD